MKTPLQKLIDWIKSENYRNIPDHVIIAKIQSLLPEEKYMVVEASRDGQEEQAINQCGGWIEYGEKYYKETYE